MTLQDLSSAALLFAGAFFFFAGAVGLLRFPDPCTRIHALTKADNLGLGFVVLGLACASPSIVLVAKLAVTWLLVLVSSSLSSQLIMARALAGAPRTDGRGPT
ncbi:MAG: monovalent cation/H(+) antiporter subunit G [Labilithrix sp.]|nr:monovalent cation/H(+) antiporter subunit G [Labilithrix sp.]MBX3215622.1 monovalent cation/H(+) antiporter subunit G [Labilithrix sp.]